MFLTRCCVFLNVALYPGPGTITISVNLWQKRSFHPSRLAPTLGVKSMRGVAQPRGGGHRRLSVTRSSEVYPPAGQTSACIVQFELEMTFVFLIYFVLHKHLTRGFLPRARLSHAFRRPGTRPSSSVRRIGRVTTLCPRVLPVIACDPFWLSQRRGRRVVASLLTFGSHPRPFLLPLTLSGGKD